MIKDIFNMDPIEFEKKFNDFYQKMKDENVSYGLPTTGYCPIQDCIIDTYPDGTKVKVDITKTRNNLKKNQYYGN
jgi:hypothetical protein